MISAIVAVDNNWGIGFEGQLLEYIPEDMKYFRETTIGNVVIMGRKTWDGLPIKPLQDRSNIILSKTCPCGSWIYDSEAHYIQFISKITENEFENFRKSSTQFFVIGGGTIYEQLLPYCDRVYVTKIHQSYENVDTYFPVDLDASPEWQQVEASDIRQYGHIAYHFLTYERV